MGAVVRCAQAVAWKKCRKGGVKVLWRYQLGTAVLPEATQASPCTAPASFHALSGGALSLARPGRRPAWLLPHGGQCSGRSAAAPGRRLKWAIKVGSCRPAWYCAQSVAPCS